MARMTTARAIVRSLVANGVDTVFGLPGVQLDALFNALHDERSRIRVIHPRHEQAAAYMAMGYAQASGEVGACVVVPGPGILNTTAALATAWAAGAPVLAITGQLPAHAIGQGYGLLHEIPDQLAILRGLTKWTERIEHPTEAAALMRDAFHRLRSGVPRPVAIESPMDVLGLEADIDGIEASPGAAPLAHAAAARSGGNAAHGSGVNRSAGVDMPNRTLTIGPITRQHERVRCCGPAFHLSRARSVSGSAGVPPARAGGPP